MFVLPAATNNSPAAVTLRYIMSIHVASFQHQMNFRARLFFGHIALLNVNAHKSGHCDMFRSLYDRLHGGNSGSRETA